MSSSRMISILKYIKHYDASETSGNLDDFIKSCEFTIGLAASVYDEKEMLAYICNVGLGGRAAQVVRQHLIDSFDDIKTILEQRFKRSKRILEFHLSNIEQQADETIDDYGSRVKSIHYQLVEIDRKDQSFGHTNINDARWYFEEGLNDKRIKFIVKSMNYKTLTESIIGAIEAEQEREILKELSDYKKKCIHCEICDQIGHIAVNCRSKFSHFKN